MRVTRRFFYLALIVKHTLYLVRPDGSEGDWIAFSSYDHIYKVRPDGTELRKLTGNS